MAYFSDYVSSPNNSLADGVILSVLFFLLVTLNFGGRYTRKIRGRERPWIVYGNRSVAWFLAAFFGALSSAIPPLVSLSLRFPVLLIALGLFLGVAFALVDLSKETDDLAQKSYRPLPIMAQYL